MTIQQRELILKTLLVSARATTWLPLASSAIIVAAVAGYSLNVAIPSGRDLEQTFELMVLILSPLPVGGVLYWVRAFIARGADEVVPI